MPNPMMRINLHPSKTNTDRPITPVMENVAGSNFAYRGPYDHGVEPTGEYQDPSAYGIDPDNPEGLEHVVVLEPEREPDPIPVRLVQEFKRELRRFGSDRITIDSTVTNNPAGRAIELLGRSDERSSVRMTNIDATNIVLVGNSREETLMRGYPLYPGKEITITTEDPIFVLAVTPTFQAPTGVVVVAYLAEYRVKEA